jgi:hypothetical protein
MDGRWWVRATAIVVLAWAAPAGEAVGDSYYAIVFGSQTHPKLLRFTHTWATFIRVAASDIPGQPILEAHTISWLPESMNIQTWTPIPEPGVNLDLEQTLRVVLDERQRVTAWGPFVISERVYRRSLEVEQVLENGGAQYRAFSTPWNLLSTNCIHAVTAVDPDFGRERYPLIRVGKPASRHIAREVMTRSPFDQYRFDNSWLISRLGLDRYPVQIVPPRAIPKRRCFLCRCPD